MSDVEDKLIANVDAERRSEKLQAALLDALNIRELRLLERRFIDEPKALARIRDALKRQGAKT